MYVRFNKYFDVTKHVLKTCLKSNNGTTASLYGFFLAQKTENAYVTNYSKVHITIILIFLGRYWVGRRKEWEATATLYLFVIQ